MLPHGLCRRVPVRDRALPARRAPGLGSISTNVVAVHDATIVAPAEASSCGRIDRPVTLMMRGNLLTRSRKYPRSWYVPSSCRPIGHSAWSSRVVIACGENPRIVRFDCVAIAWTRRRRSATSRSSGRTDPEPLELGLPSSRPRGGTRGAVARSSTALAISVRSDASSCASHCRGRPARAAHRNTRTRRRRRAARATNAANLSVPRQLLDAQVHRHCCVSGGRGRPLARPSGAAPSRRAPPQPPHPRSSIGLLMRAPYRELDQLRRRPPRRSRRRLHLAVRRFRWASGRASFRCSNSRRSRTGR